MIVEMKKSCPACGAEAYKGRSFCARCYMKNRRARYAASGLCTACGSPPIAGRRRCSTCTSQQNAATRRCQAKKAGSPIVDRVRTFDDFVRENGE